MIKCKKIGLFAFAIFLLGWCIPVQAAQDNSPYKMEIESGLQGVIRSTDFLPVQIDITSDEDFRGSVEIPCSVRAWYADTNSVLLDALLPDINSEDIGRLKKRDYTYRKQIELSAGESIHVTFNVAVPDTMQELTVRLLNEDGAIVKEQTSLLDENRYSQRIIVGVVSSDPATAESIEAQQYGEKLRYPADVIEMTAEEIPADMRLLEQMDALVLMGVSLQNLPKTVKMSLYEWEQSREKGLIQSVSSEDAVEKLKEYFTDERVAETGVVISSTSVSSDLSKIPVKQQPSVLLYGTVLIVYAVFAGPGLYLILKRLKKRYFLWVGITASAVGFTILIAVLGSQTRMRAPFISYAEKYVQSGESVVREVNFGIQAPYNQGYSLYVDSSFDLVPAMEVNDMEVVKEKAGKSQGESIDIEYQEGRYKLSMKRNAAFSPEYFTIHCQENIMGGITAEGGMTEKGLSGSVRNNTPYGMKDVFLLMPESIVYVGDLPSGREVLLKDCERYTYSIGGLNNFFGTIPEFAGREETKYLQEVLMDEIFDLYQNGSLKSYVFGVMQKEEMDFQLDSGYKAYGYSLYRAAADISYQSGNKIYCPFGQYRMQLSDGDYMDQQWPASYLSTDGEMTVYYSLKSTLKQICGEEAKVTGISMYMPDFAESDSQIPWKGTVSFYNRRRGQYDQIAQWEETMTEEMLEPYLGSDGMLIVKYESAFLTDKKRNEDDQMIIPSINLSGEVTEDAAD